MSVFQRQNPAKNRYYPEIIRKGNVAKDYCKDIAGPNTRYGYDDLSGAKRTGKYSRTPILSTLDFGNTPILSTF